MHFPFEGGNPSYDASALFGNFPTGQKYCVYKKNPNTTNQKQISKNPNKQACIHLTWEETSGSTNRTVATFVTKSQGWE